MEARDPTFGHAGFPSTESEEELEFKPGYGLYAIGSKRDEYFGMAGLVAPKLADLQQEFR